VTGHAIQQALREFWDAMAAWRESTWSSGTGVVRTGGSHRPLVQLLIDMLVECGVERSAIHENTRIHLPGSYRPTPRTWDLIVLDDGFPVAVLEIMFTRSIKNISNRHAEIVGAAADVSRAYGPAETRPMKPFVGLIFILEDTEETRRLRASRPDVAFGSDQDGLSYQQRIAESFRRMLHDGLYDAIWYLTSRQPPDFSVHEPDEQMTFAHFSDVVIRRIDEISKARERSGVDAVAFGMMLARRDDLDEVLSGLTSTPEGLSAAEAAIIQQHRKVVAKLRALAMDPHTNETTMQAAIGRRYWLFGGQYVGVAERTLVPLDQYDIPLICADNSLHIVELKGPEAKLVRRHRNHLIVANEVHEAVSQCLNYLRSLDEAGATLQTLHRNELGTQYDYRRSRGTVLIGHPERVSIPGVTRAQIDQTIRSYNAHLTRIQVVTYTDLLDSAERALRFEAECPDA
jgi:hypothetical protein